MKCLCVFPAEHGVMSYLYKSVKRVPSCLSDVQSKETDFTKPVAKMEQKGEKKERMEVKSKKVSY